MAKKKMGGLGKGLDSLFADLSDDTGSEASNSTLPLREIEPDPEQPRKRFDDDALNQLADSITENGLLQPIAVRPKKVGPGLHHHCGRAPLACRTPGRAGRGAGHHQGCDRRAGRRAGAD